MPESRLAFTLHRLVAVLDRHADVLLRRSMGMTYRQFLFLVRLADDDGVDGAALAERLDVSRAAVSKRLPWFEERGLVDVRDDPHDARRRTIHLTAQGRRRVLAASDLLEGALRLGADGRLDLDLEGLHADLSALLASLEAHLPDEAVR